MKGTISQIKNMEMESSYGLMVGSILAVGRRINSMDLVHMYPLVGRVSRESE